MQQFCEQEMNLVRLTFQTPYGRIVPFSELFIPKELLMCIPKWTFKKKFIHVTCDLIQSYVHAMS